MKLFQNIYFKNIFWNFLNQFGKSGFQIVVTLVLARLLTPDDFGTIAMITIITQFAELIIDSGFLLGIVQVKDITQRELTAVFYLNLLLGIVCTLIIFFSAPLIAEIYHVPELTRLTRILSISCIFTASAVVQHGLMIREMNYKNRTIAQVISQLVSGIIAIVLAFKGFGVMSLIYYSLFQSGLSALLYWAQSKWRPGLTFAFADLSRVWRFSSNILGVTILGNVAGRTDLFLTGKFFEPRVLGFYSKGKDFAMLPATVGGEIVNLSLFPILARMDGEEFSQNYKKILKVLVFAASFLFALLSINAREITVLLLGEGWRNAGVIFQLYFIVAFFYMVNTFFTSVINATGKSRVNLKKELIQSPLRIFLLIAIYYLIRPESTLPFIYFWIIYYICSNIYSQFLLAEICGLDFLKTVFIGWRYIIVCLAIGIGVYHLISFENNIIILFTRSAIFTLLFAIVIFISKDDIVVQARKILNK